MPRRVVSKEETPQPTKRERLTLSQLASYDDIITDALVDHVYFWTTIRKNRSKYNLTRGFSEEDVTDILRQELVLNHDNTKAEERLLKLSGLKRFMDRLKSKREKDDFRKHLRKYVNMWSRDCPFEVATTNRYTIVTQEAAIVARRELKKGEVVKYLCGNLVAMTAEEEKDLDLTRRDFSIVMSSRRKTPSLFLGPARFANHDCNANASLVTTGTDGMQVVAQRLIPANEEITVTYGEDYFGIDNCECLCKTCEDYMRNGWALTSAPDVPSRPVTPATTTASDNEGPHSFRKKRRLDSSGLSSGALTPTTDERPSKRSRSVSSEGSIRAQITLDRTNRPSPRKSGLANELPSPAMNSPQPLSVPCIAEMESPKTSSSLSTAMNTSQQPRGKEPGLSSGLSKVSSFSQTPTDYSDSESIFDVIELVRTTSTPSTPPSTHHSDTKVIELAQTISRPSTPTSTHHSETKASEPYSIPNLKFEEIEPKEPDPKAEHDEVVDDSSSLSSLSSSEAFDDANARIIKKPRQTRGRTKLAPPPPLRPRSLQPSDSPFPSARSKSDDPSMPASRYPGDYTRTTALLSEPYSRWVDCLTCKATWVQSNGYNTRRECPRCERHSKLYGFKWPKTDPTKKGDARVTDHRTVHRFLDNEEEKGIVRRGRGIKKEGMI